RSRPESPVRRAALGIGSAVVPGQYFPDVRDGNPPVYVRGDQMLLQLRLLDKDGVIAAGARLRVHGSSPHCANGPDRWALAAGAFDGSRLAGPLVRRGLGRALDRVFLTSDSILCTGFRRVAAMSSLAGFPSCG